MADNDTDTDEASHALLVDLLTRMHIEDPEVVADVIVRAGFTLPVAIHTHAECQKLPPDSILRDDRGRGWKAGTVTAEDFTEHTPWCLVDNPILDSLDNE